MKKICFVTLSLIATFLLVACSEKKITVKGADGTEYESYQECCAAQDFQAAHQFLAKIENTEDSGFDLYDAKEYVFKQEALFLMSQNDEAAKKRIVYLLKEEGGNDEHVEMLIDLAIDNDDEDFVKTMANQIKGSYHSEQTLKKVMEYLSSKGNEENKAYLISLLKKHDKNSLLIDFAIKSDDKKLIDECLASNSFSLHNDKLLNYLAASKEKKYADLMIGQLTTEEGDISKKPQMGFVDFHGSGQCTTEFEDLCNSYIQTTEYFNNCCQNILGVAIKTGNQYLAQRVVSKFRSNINVVDGKTGGSYKVTTNNEDINNAKSTYQEAVRSGAFK